MAEEPRRRRRVDEVALAPRRHPGRHRAGRVDVGHDVDVPVLPPLRIGRVRTAHAGDPGVGDEHVDGTEGFFRRGDEAADGGLVGDVAGHRAAADRGGGFPECVLLEVGDGHAAGAFRSEAARQRKADAARAAGDDDRLAPDLHPPRPAALNR